MDLNRVIRVIGWISIVGGAIAGAIVGYDSYDEEMSWSVFFGLAVSGVISGVLFLAIAKALEFLEEIASNTRSTSNMLDSSTKSKLSALANNTPSIEQIRAAVERV